MEKYAGIIYFVTDLCLLFLYIKMIHNQEESIQNMKK